MFKSLLGGALAVLAMVWGPGAQARGEPITVGQVAPLKVPTSVGNQLRAGIELYFEVVNRAGGVAGAPLRLVTKHREDAADVALRTRELVRESKPVALIGMQGTGPMEALIRQGAVAEVGLPIVGIRTGAVSLHVPMNPWLFHTRANYLAEMRKIVGHLVPVGYKRFAVFHEDTAFGHEGLQHAQVALSEVQAAAPLVIAFNKDGSDLHAKATMLLAGPDAVIAIGETASVAELQRIVRTSSARPQVMTLSTVDAAQVVKLIGAQHAHGLGITQVVPNPTNRKHPLVREYQDQVARLRPADFELTAAGMEGYVAARVLVEGLRRCPPNATPLQVRTALETMGRLDLGGINLEFGPRRRSGTSNVEIGVIGVCGKLLQ